MCKNVYTCGVGRVLLNTYCFRPKSTVKAIFYAINFLWNLSKTFVSAYFVFIRILPLLPVDENDLFAPENFKVLFQHDKLRTDLTTSVLTL